MTPAAEARALVNGATERPITGPYSGPGQSGSNAPDPAYADDGLVITGNVIVNGDATMSLGLGDESGCQASNPTCDETQLYADNDINGR